MSDRELLELAAKAADVDGNYMEFWGGTGIAPDRPDGGLWNPLEDDGASLRLAVKLRMCVSNEGSEAVAITFTGFTERETIGTDADPYSATRRAIVRAAAEIGRHVP